MKAAIVRESGRSPVYTDFPDPVPSSGEARISVTASAISQNVKSRAAGRHYSASNEIPFVVGIDGVGRLDDGSRVYFVMPSAPNGSMAEQTVVQTGHCIPLPDNLDDTTAAAIANPGMSSWAAYTERAGLRSGETVLINGATGTAGRLAVQIAKYLGAGKVIVTGRDAEALLSLAALGADITIPLHGSEQELNARLEAQFASGIDVVVDYLWGKSAEQLLVAGAEAGPDGRPIRFVQVGSASGQDITLPSAVLRSSAIELKGSGIGSIPIDRLVKIIGDVLRVTAPGAFRIAFEQVPLSNFEQAWAKDDSKRRTVFTMSGQGS